MCSAARALIPRGEGFPDALGAVTVIEAGRHGDLKHLAVEADLGRRPFSGLDDHLDIAAEVGEGLAGDEAPGKRIFRKIRHPFDDPRGPVEHDVPNLGVGGPGGGGHEDSLGGQPNLDGPLAPRATSHFVGDGGPVEGNLASSPRGESSVISLVAWRLLQFTEDYKALAMSGLLARPEKRTTPSFSARGATPSIAPLHEVPEDDLDSVHVGELVVGGDGVLGAALRVLDDELQHAPVNSAGGVDLVQGHLLGLQGDGAIGLAGTGEGLHDAYAVGGGFVFTASTGDDKQREDGGED